MAEIIRFKDLAEKQEAEGRMTKLEFEARVKWLEGYISAMHKMRSADMRLEELEMDYGPGVPKLTGTPSGSKADDGSGRIIRRMEDKKHFAAEYNRSRDAAILHMRRIEAVISEISPKLQNVLRYRYINDMDIDEIAIAVNYSYRQVQRHHQQGVERIRPPRHEINKIKAELQKDHPEWSLVEIKSA